MRDSVVGHDKYFVQKRNYFDKLGINSHVKVTAAFHILAYGLLLDAIDNLMLMSETTVRETLKCFCYVVIETFGSIYVRGPTLEEVETMLKETKRRSIPGLLGVYRLLHVDVEELLNCMAQEVKGEGEDDDRDV